MVREGSIPAEIGDGQIGTLLNNMTFLSDAFTPVTAVALPDSAGNGVSELAILATRNSDGRILVQSRNAAGALTPTDYGFSP